jgi:hypothetical protein
MRCMVLENRGFMIACGCTLDFIRLAAVLLPNISTCFDVGNEHLLPVDLLGETDSERLYVLILK